MNVVPVSEVNGKLSELSQASHLLAHGPGDDVDDNGPQVRPALPLLSRRRNGHQTPAAVNGTFQRERPSSRGTLHRTSFAQTQASRPRRVSAVD